MPRKRKIPPPPPNQPLYAEVRPLNPSARPCDIPSCPYVGEHRAPYSKQELDRYRWFCLTHVREYNANWDYFSGMAAMQIEDFMKDAMLGHRPTWKFNQQHLTTDTLEEALHAMLHGTRRGAAEERKRRATFRSQSEEERRALAVLDLEGEVTLQQIKKQYKLLVKKHHPDVNKGDKRSEERFKRITKAYHTLMSLQKDIKADD